MTSEIVFLLTSLFGIAGVLLGKHIGHRDGYNEGFMAGHDEAMIKAYGSTNVRVITTRYVNKGDEPSTF